MTYEGVNVRNFSETKHLDDYGLLATKVKLSKEETQLDAGVLKEMVEEALRQLEDVRNEAEGAENNAYEAKNSADTACDYASSARDEADTAETYAMDCKRELDNLEGILDGLMDKLKQETGDEVSLDVQIARYTPKIKELRSRGCGADEIAERLSISSVIVNIVLERQDAA